MATPWDPYAPPRTDRPGVAAAAPLTAELEMRAMAELGKRRSRAKVRAFAVMWMLFTGGLAVIGVGLLPAFLAGAGLAGVGSRAYLRGRNRALAEAVCRDLGIDPAAFAPERYLVD